MSRPLLISDCDEVLLHMIVPFRDWLDDAHHIHFDLVHGDWGEALRHKHDGTVVERGQVWELLNGFLLVGGKAHRRHFILHSTGFVSSLCGQRDRFHNRGITPVFAKSRYLGLAGEYTPC